VARVSDGEVLTYPENRVTLEPAPGEVHRRLEVAGRLVLGQRRRLDLVVDDRRDLLAVLGPPCLEVEEALHAPLEARGEDVLELSLCGNRLAEPW
jgi:hypothetical protein